MQKDSTTLLIKGPYDIIIHFFVYCYFIYLSYFTPMNAHLCIYEIW